MKIIKEIFPHQKIEREYNIAKHGGLFLDVFLKDLSLAFEFDGVQHHEFVEHFHGTKENFLKAQKRDLEKNDLCQQQGITLIRVAHYEKMTKDLILKKIEEAQKNEE